MQPDMKYECFDECPHWHRRDKAGSRVRLRRGYCAAPGGVCTGNEDSESEYPTPVGSVHVPMPRIPMPIPYPYEVAAQERIEHLEAERLRLLTRIAELEPKDAEGLFTVDMIDGGVLVDEINDHLQQMGADIHLRSDNGDKRIVTVKIELSPSESSTAAKIVYQVASKTPEAKGAGLAYLDGKGRLVSPESVKAEQIMLPTEKAA